MSVVTRGMGTKQQLVTRGFGKSLAARIGRFVIQASVTIREYILTSIKTRTLW